MVWRNASSLPAHSAQDSRWALISGVALANPAARSGIISRVSSQLLVDFITASFTQTLPETNRLQTNPLPTKPLHKPVIQTRAAVRARFRRRGTAGTWSPTRSASIHPRSGDNPSADTCASPPQHAAARAELPRIGGSPPPAPAAPDLLPRWARRREHPA